MEEIQKAILRTLAYADIFDYPLKQQEIWKFLVANFQFSIFNFQKELNHLPKSICIKDDLYFLRGREKIVAIRQKRKKYSKEKFKIARRVAGWLKLIPTIKMVAVTGALAMNNADQDDDIDLLIVSQKNRLWLTRLMVVLLTEVVTQRRRPGDVEFKDKICLNMFLDEDHLAVPKNEQDLFSCHEVCQLRPIWEKDRVYQKFIKSNQWVKQYLPNWKP